MSEVSQLRRCLLRDLDSVIDEIAAFPDDNSVWFKPTGAPNSAGTLALHLAGNLRHFIGALLGNTGYLRQREVEFSDTGLSREELIAGIRAAIHDVEATLGALDESSLSEPFPVEIAGARLSTGQVLIHLATHTAYHLGQMDYCRRISTGDPHSIGAMGLKGLL